MQIKQDKLDWIFLFLCFIVGFLAQEAFFPAQIGISYIIFIVVFYALFFWRFRSYTFTHQRLGYLVLIAVWLLAAGYYLYDTNFFYGLNILVIPSLVIFHLALVTAPQKIQWSHPTFILYIAQRLIDGLIYNGHFSKLASKQFKRGDNPQKFDVWKKVLIGMLISIPFLFIILNLLISADTQFKRLIESIPNLFTINPEYIFRTIVILIYTFGFFGYMQALMKKHIQPIKRNAEQKLINMDGIISFTVLILLDFVYLVFVIVQFKYFFSGQLDDGFTYAEYARRGFFELLFVTLINLTITTGVIQFTKGIQGTLKMMIRSALTVLVLSSGVLLVSAFMRMMMYEEAYGYTFLRVLVTSFMVFLMVIFAYTLVKIWLEKLSLFHFYFIASLIYYVGINMMNIDKIVVDQNIARYEETGKIDFNYLNNVSATGKLGLIELYEKYPDELGLQVLLIQEQKEIDFTRSDAWQSRNLTRDKAYEKLKELEF